MSLHVFKGIPLRDLAIDPAEVAEQHELVDIVRQGLTTLEFREELFFRLHYLQPYPLSYEEIARAYHTPYPTVTVTVCRARRKLANYIRREHPDCACGS